MTFSTLNFTSIAQDYVGVGDTFVITDPQGYVYIFQVGLIDENTYLSKINIWRGIFATNAEIVS